MSKDKIYVVVVDDDESFARALERLFRASGFGVRTYPSAEAFLAATTLPQPDCLVVDIQLGGMSGLDLQRRLRELGALAPIIFVTAHDAPGVREEAQQAGCSACFLKPVPGKSLLEAIARAVSPGSRSSQNDCETEKPALKSNLKPFMPDLNDIKKLLDSELSRDSMKSASGLIKQANWHGEDVVESLKDVETELDRVSAELAKYE